MYLIFSKESSKNPFLLGLLSAAGMGLWHGVEYYEKEKMIGEEYFQQWSNVSI